MHSFIPAKTGLALHLNHVQPIKRVVLFGKGSLAWKRRAPPVWSCVSVLWKIRKKNTSSIGQLEAWVKVAGQGGRESREEKRKRKREMGELGYWAGEC